LKDISKLAVVLGLKLNLRDEEITIILKSFFMVSRFVYNQEDAVFWWYVHHNVSDCLHEVQPVLAKRIIPKYVAFACTCIYDEAFGFQFQNYLKAERKISCRGYLMF